MPTLRAICRWNWTTGRPEDVSVNVFHFINDGVRATVTPEIVAALNAFYDDALGNDQRSPLIDASGGSIKMYDLSEPEPRVPYFEDDLDTLSGSAGSTALPPEAAMVVSFRAAVTSGQNKRRRMGRIYLGPFSTQALSSGTGRPNTGFITNIVTAANGLLYTSKVNTTFWSWAVYSPTDDAAREIIEGYVNNEFDTQRRRGLPDTVRSPFDGT